jgi:signal transduction histidine kinase
MPCADDVDNAPPPADLDQLRHDLKTSRTTISGHAQLLGRVIRRSPSLTDAEQARMLRSLATIEQAVRAMVRVIDTMADDGADGSPDTAG